MTSLQATTNSVEMIHQSFQLDKLGELGYLAKLGKLDELKKLDENSIKFWSGSIMILLQLGEKTNIYKAIEIIKYLQCIKIHIESIITIIEFVLPFSDIIFMMFVKSINNNILNKITNLDALLHRLEPDVIMKLLKHNIIDIEQMALISDITIEKAILYTIQFSLYNDNIIQYLINKYIIKEQDIPQILQTQQKLPHTQQQNTQRSHNIFMMRQKIQHRITQESILDKFFSNLVRHMVCENVQNEICVYIKACITGNMIEPEVLNFKNILISFNKLNNTFKDDIDNRRLRSRLIGVIKLISTYCLDKLLTIPTYKDYQTNFNKFRNLNNLETIKNNKKLLIQIDLICQDSYNFINLQLPWGSRHDY